MNEGRREGEKGETGRVRRRGLVSAVNGPCFVQCIVGAGGLFFFFEGGVLFTSWCYSALL